MTSIVIGFPTSPLFGGAGTGVPLGFYSVYGPELGCIGIGLSGIADLTTTIARITDRARILLARSLTDGTSIRVVKFAFGAGGYDPVDPLRPLFVDTTATFLLQETYRKAVDVYETPSIDGRSRSFAARLARNELVGGIGEVALIARILSSPFPAEIGTEFLFAIAHQGLRAKSRNHVETYRVIVTI